MDATWRGRSALGPPRRFVVAHPRRTTHVGIGIGGGADRTWLYLLLALGAAAAGGALGYWLTDGVFASPLAGLGSNAFSSGWIGGSLGFGGGLCVGLLVVNRMARTEATGDPA